MSNWIQTYTGNIFDYEKIEENIINIEDIAHSLSLTCRYTGHCEEFYSVAEHSIRCSSWLKRKKQTKEIQMWGLLHDAAEAYIGDIATPLKKISYISYRYDEFDEIEELEQQILAQISNQFELKYPLPTIIKEADKVLLSTEVRDLLKIPKKMWSPPLIKPLRNHIVPLSPKDAEILFLEKFEELHAGSKISSVYV